jgi:glutathione synthase/RimK-type ligase-like ATP-grasp enzyme
MRLCILTPDPAYHHPWVHIADKYGELLGGACHFRPMAEPGDLSGFDMILPLLAWGYHLDLACWYTLLDRLEREGLPLCNPVPLLRWNSDKAYLADLAAAGVAVVPTIHMDRLDDAALVAARARFATDCLVIKPPVSGGADGTFLLGAHDGTPAGFAGRRMLIQPHCPAISTEGEWSLFYFGDRYSHAIIKRPASGDFRVQEQFGGREEAVDPPADALALAEAALAAAPTATLYARIDMVRMPDATLALMELELIEPALFLHLAGDGGDAFAAAVRDAIGPLPVSG